MFRSRLVMIVAAASLAVLGLALAARLVTQPRTLRIAVGQATGENLKLVSAFAQSFTREHADIRLKLMSVENSAAAAAALDNGKADLAVSRADIALPRHGETVAIMHRDPVVILATARSGITKPADLAGHSLGLVPGLVTNAAILNQVLSYYEVPAEGVKVERLDTEHMAAAVQEGRVDALVMVVPLGSRILHDAYEAVAIGGGGTPHLVALPEAKAIAQRHAALEDEEIVQGAFGGNPPVPPESARTISVVHRLFASRDLAETTVSELTRLIFAYKQTVAVDLPLANRIEQISSENSTLPVHVGATAYYDGEVKTFMEIWGDWIYIGAMVFGFAGSVVAAMFGRSSARSRAQANNLLGDLLGLLSRARAADSRSVLDDIEHQADLIFAATVSGAAENRIDPGAISTFSFAFDQVRKAIDDRRKLV